MSIYLVIYMTCIGLCVGYLLGQFKVARQAVRDIEGWSKLAHELDAECTRLYKIISDLRGEAKRSR